MKMTENAWLDFNGHKFGDDQQAMYFAQLQAIMRGELDMVINEDHEQAWQHEKALLSEFFARAKQEAF